MKNAGFCIYTKINRPARELIDSFAAIPVANIDDCMNRTACLDAKIRPMNQARLLGTALTVKARPGDNLLTYKAIQLAQPGDVIVIATQGETSNAIIGELMITWAQRKGVAGFVIDGAIRDADAIANMSIPVYAAGVNPNGPYKEGPGEINVPVALHGVVVHPGDILVGDGDGVIAINPQEAAEILQKAKAVADKEAGIMKAIQADSWDTSWVDKMLIEKGCTILNEEWKR